MEGRARQQQRYRRRQRLKEWASPHAYVLTLFTIATTLLTALGRLPQDKGNWLAFATAIATLICLIIERRPKKTNAEQVLERMQKQARQAKRVE